MICSILLYFCYMTSFVITGHSSAILTGEIQKVNSVQSPTINIRNIPTSKTGTTKFIAVSSSKVYNTNRLIPMIISMSCFIVGFGALGFMLSLLTRNHGLAILLCYVLILIIFAVTIVAWYNISNNEPSSSVPT